MPYLAFWNECCFSPGELARAEGVGGRAAVEESRELQRQRETMTVVGRAELKSS